MGRHEEQRAVADAGVKWTKMIRTEDTNVPIYIFCSRRGVIAHEIAAKEAGANGVTSLALTLLGWVGFS